MKIIVEGKTPRQKLDGTICSCNQCGCKIEIDSRDDLQYECDQRESEYWFIRCPTKNCNATIYVNSKVNDFPER